MRLSRSKKSNYPTRCRTQCVLGRWTHGRVKMACKLVPVGVIATCIVTHCWLQVMAESRPPMTPKGSSSSYVPTLTDIKDLSMTEPMVRGSAATKETVQYPTTPTTKRISMNVSSLRRRRRLQLGATRRIALSKLPILTRCCSWSTLVASITPQRSEVWSSTYFDYSWKVGPMCICLDEVTVDVVESFARIRTVQWESRSGSCVPIS